MVNSIISRDLIYSILIDEYIKCKKKYLEYKYSCLSAISKMYYGSMDEIIILYSRLSCKTYDECKNILEYSCRSSMRLYG